MQAEDLHLRLNRYIPIRPTPKQAAFLLLAHKEAFYGGAAGGGKSVALLAAALQYADVPGYAALLIRRSYMELMQPNGLIDLSKKWLASTDAVWRESDYTWRFLSGATLTFRYLQDARSELSFQGGEYQFIGIDEVTELEENAYTSAATNSIAVSSQRPAEACARSIAEVQAHDYAPGSGGWPQAGGPMVGASTPRA